MRIIKILIQHGALINIRNVRGESPLWWAVMDKDGKISQILINKGANLDDQDYKKKLTPSTPQP